MLAALVAGTAALVLAVAGYGVAETTRTPEVRTAALALPDWPRGAPPVRVALLSDIHAGNRAMTPARLGQIVAQVNAAHPDLVLIAGDFLIGAAEADPARYAAALLVPLRGLTPPLGTIAVLGNHDHWAGRAAVTAALERVGVTVLVNAAARRGPLNLIGVGDAFSGHDDFAATLRAAYGLGGAQVVVTHAPDLVPKLPPGFALVLAGHTHCGQIVLPGMGSLFRKSPKRGWHRIYDPHYRCEIVRDRGFGDGGRTTVITGGLGSGSVPLRIGAPPDWWLLTLGPNGVATR